MAYDCMTIHTTTIWLYKHPNLLVHTPVDGHLGCLGITNKGAINIYVHISIRSDAFLSLGVEWLDQQVGVCVAF